MARVKPVKTRVVGVIAALADLRRADADDAADLYELRLDVLQLQHVEKFIDRLTKPLIVTARHPREGGLNNLSVAQRAALLEKFLPHAAYIDVELRSVLQLQHLLAAARRRRVRIIISVHDFARTPSRARLHAFADEAKRAKADVVKIATRTKNDADVARLLELAEPKVCVMGMGPLAFSSRIAAAKAGAPFVYGSMGEAVVDGQRTVGELRAAFLSLAGKRKS